MSEGPTKTGTNRFRLGLVVAFGIGLCLLLMPIVDDKLNPLVGVAFSGLMFVGGLATAKCAGDSRYRKAGWMAVAFGLPFVIATAVVFVMTAFEVPRAQISD